MLEKKTTKEQIDIICKDKSYIELLDMLRDIYEDNKIWISQESIIKWLAELEARIMLDYSKEELLLGVRERIKELKGEK